MSFTTVHPGQLSIITNDGNNRPLSFVEGGDRLGYEPAVARAVCQRLALEPVWFHCAIDNFYTTLSNGHYDVVWFNQAITQERRAWADFTRPYGRFDVAVLVREDSPIYAAPELAGKRLGSLADSTSMTLTEEFPDLEWVPFTDQGDVLAEMVNALKQGDIDALVHDAPP